MTDQDPKPAEASELVGDIFKRAGDLPNPTPEERERRERDRERASLELIRSTRRSDSRRRFEVACPSDLRVTDWNHPRLVPYRAQQELIRNHKPGTRGLLAFGESGRGKSRAMWSLMERLCCEEGRDVRMFMAADWFAELQNQVSFGHDFARGWIDASARRPLVFIDDFGQEAMLLAKSDWALGWFFRFLDIRVGEKLPLFLTTNVSSKQLVVRGGNVRGDPMVRRLLDVCELVIF